MVQHRLTGFSPFSILRGIISPTWLMEHLLRVKHLSRHWGEQTKNKQNHPALVELTF